MPTTQNTTPKLRFSEFREGWRFSTLGNECAHISYGLTVRPNFVVDGIPLISAREVITGKVDIEHAPKIGLRDFNKLSDKAKPKNGDIFLTKTGSIGFSALFTQNETIAITQNIAVIRLDDIRTNSSLYLIQYFKTNKFYRRAIIKVNQSTIMDLQLGDIRNLLAPLPTLPEQQKIAAFLTAIDTKIEQLTQKKSLLENYKKGAMQQLFSQAIRFKDKQGNPYPDWEEKRLGEVLKIGSGRDYKHLQEGNIPVYGTGGLMTNVNDYLYDGESVGIGRKGTIDKPVYLKSKFWTVDTLFYTHSFADCMPKFIYYIFLSINWKKHNEASGVPSLSKTTIEKIKIPFPSIEEQTQIANFLSAIDAKIELVDTQLNNTQHYKKGLLQQMFV